MAETKPESLTDIWSSAGAPPASLAGWQNVEVEIDTERVFEEFKEGVAKNISGADAESHSHLAEAYREMGLYVDAVREAAIAVNAAVAQRSVEGPLRFLLTPPLLRPDGLERLRERLRRREP